MVCLNQPRVPEAIFLQFLESSKASWYPSTIARANMSFYHWSFSHVWVLSVSRLGSAGKNPRDFPAFDPYGEVSSQMATRCEASSGKGPTRFWQRPGSSSRDPPFWKP